MSKKLKKIHITLITVAVVAVILGSLYLFDVVRAKSFKLELCSLTTEAGDALEAFPADGRMRICIAIKLTDSSGKPVSGHTVTLLADGSGTIINGGQMCNAQSDSEGMVYYKYVAETYIEDEYIVWSPTPKFKVIDVSNSVFFEVNAKTEFIIPLTAP